MPLTINLWQPSSPDGKGGSPLVKKFIAIQLKEGQTLLPGLLDGNNNIFSPDALKIFLEDGTYKDIEWQISFLRNWGKKIGGTTPLTARDEIQMEEQLRLFHLLKKVTFSMRGYEQEVSREDAKSKMTNLLLCAIGISIGIAIGPAAFISLATTALSSGMHLVSFFGSIATAFLGSITGLAAGAVNPLGLISAIPAFLGTSYIAYKSHAIYKTIKTKLGELKGSLDELIGGAPARFLEAQNENRQRLIATLTGDDRLGDLHENLASWVSIIIDNGIISLSEHLGGAYSASLLLAMKNVLSIPFRLIGTDALNTLFRSIGKIAYEIKELGEEFIIEPLEQAASVLFIRQPPVEIDHRSSMKDHLQKEIQQFKEDFYKTFPMKSFVFNDEESLFVIDENRLITAYNKLRTERADYRKKDPYEQTALILRTMDLPNYIENIDELNLRTPAGMENYLKLLSTKLYQLNQASHHLETEIEEYLSYNLAERRTLARIWTLKEFKDASSITFGSRSETIQKIDLCLEILAQTEDEEEQIAILQTILVLCIQHHYEKPRSKRHAALTNLATQASMLLARHVSGRKELKDELGRQYEADVDYIWPENPEVASASNPSIILKPQLPYSIRFSEIIPPEMAEKLYALTHCRASELKTRLQYSFKRDLAFKARMLQLNHSLFLFQDPKTLGNKRFSSLMTLYKTLLNVQAADAYLGEFEFDKVRMIWNHIDFQRATKGIRNQTLKDIDSCLAFFHSADLRQFTLLDREVLLKITILAAATELSRDYKEGELFNKRKIPALSILITQALYQLLRTPNFYQTNISDVLKSLTKRDIEAFKRKYPTLKGTLDRIYAILDTEEEDVVTESPIMQTAPVLRPLSTAATRRSHARDEMRKRTGQNEAREKLGQSLGTRLPLFSGKS